MAVKKKILSKKVNNVSKEKLLKEIERKAFELFLKRNCTHGNDLIDWLEAEKIVKKQYGI